ncbi:MAG: sigma-70 family RNA polymerase sigma factor [Planctomycetota bacterium]
MTTTEASLQLDDRSVAAAKAGSLEAFEELVRRHARPLYAYLHRLCGDRQETEDLIQETWLRVHKAIERFEGRSSFRTWLYRIATNRFRETYAKKRRRERLAPAPEPDEVRSEPGESMRLGELETAVRSAIDRLPGKQRSVAVLSIYEELTPRDIAEVLGLKAETVRVHLHLARKRLQRDLDPFLEA